MDWSLAIDRHRVALLRIVAGLSAMLGNGEGVRRHVYLTILAVLRPAEAAVRRLVVIAARGVVVGPWVAKGPPSGVISVGEGVRVPSFRLFDPRKRIGVQRQRMTRAPRLSGIGFDDPVFTARAHRTPDDLVQAHRVERRLWALRAALDDLPKQARRLMRALARPGQKYLRPMRPGRPPGYRGRGRDEIDGLLADCHALAFYALHPPDT